MQALGSTVSSTVGATNPDLRVDKKEQAKSMKTIQDYFDSGEVGKALKYCNISKPFYL